MWWYPPRPSTLLWPPPVRVDAQEAFAAALSTSIPDWRADLCWSEGQAGDWCQQLLLLVIQISCL